MVGFIGQVAADVVRAKLVDEACIEDVSLAERQVLVKKCQGACTALAKRQIADHVCVLGLVRDVADRCVVVFAESVIDADDERMRVVGLRHPEVGCPELHGHPIDSHILHVGKHRVC